MRTAILAVTLLGVGFGAVLFAAPARAEAPGSAVELKEQLVGDVYEVDASFRVQKPAATAWSVLTDYEGLPRFVEALRKSVVKVRTDETVVVEQKAKVRALVFSTTMTVLLEIREEKGGRLLFRDVSRRDFAEYEGHWSVTEQQNGEVQVSYRLRAKPKAMVPAFIGMGAFRESALELLEAVRAEINQRKTPLQAALESGR